MKRSNWRRPLALIATGAAAIVLWQPIAQLSLFSDLNAQVIQEPAPMTYGLVNIAAASPSILLDIRYATKNNFLHFPVYPRAACYLQKEVAIALCEVQEEFSQINLGLKIFDGYRPLSVQQLMWDTIQDERYVSNPAKGGGRHTRGTAVDLTLVDADGNELEMPTGFDDFTERAHSDYMALGEMAIKNRALLREVMERHGFHQLPTEWWHFDFDGWRDEAKYPPLDVNFDTLDWLARHGS